MSHVVYWFQRAKVVWVLHVGHVRGPFQRESSRAVGLGKGSPGELTRVQADSPKN